MRRMRRLVVTVLSGVTILLATAVPTLAHGNHSHTLETPGEDPLLAACPEMADTAFHNLHSNLHVGTPGTFAFDLINNPVDIVGALCQ